MTHPSCSGPCEQGKKPCPCPHACQTPIEDEPPNGDLAAAVAVVIVVWTLAVIIIPAIAGYFWS